MRAVTRRAVLAGAATASVAATLAFRAGAPARPSLAIYDSRLPEARAFAATARARGVPVHDIAGEGGDPWGTLRSLARRPGRAVVGLTGWTDWVSIRGLFTSHGLRVRHEAKVPSSHRTAATPFEWALA